MGTTKSAIALGTNEVLTNTFTQIGNSFLIAQESQAALDITYTSGSGETGSALEFQIEFSANGTSNWVPETYGNISNGIDTLTPLVHKVSGGAGATVYAGKYSFPVTAQYVQIKVKEIGVNSNFGSVTIVATIAAASGQSQNLQTSSFSGSVGTVDQGTGGSSPWLIKIDQSGTNNDVDVVSSVLPTGAATEATLSTLNAKVTTVNTGAVTISTALPAGSNTIGKIDQGIGGASAWKVDGSGVTQPVSGTVTANAGTGTFVTKETQPSTGTVTSVASNASNVTLLASNANRRQATFYNDSTQVLYLKLGASASSSSYTVQLNSNDYYELPQPVYTGIIDGVWAIANGNARITELT